ncbi:MAG TPA: phosphocholine cytidylyltransferase family protein [Gammaproteobacteria bacterium]|nr:phosphocholine cytidylyltransferase family protein [Gammaproteobacteria bacterium]
MTDSNRISTALLLAAGTGTRLRPLTRNAPKCLTEVGDRPILDRLIHNLRAKGINRLVVVLGHQGDQIRKFLRHKAGDMRVDYVVNPDYRTTNNLYSLWLARQQIQESFLLVESDLVFEARMLDDMLYPDRIAISRLRPWMNGTTVALGFGKQVAAFHPDCNNSDTPRYKTVNLYSLSLETWQAMEERLSDYVSNGRLGVYYEAVFADMVADGSLAFDAVFFDADRWYEIDTLADLDAAEKLFGSRRSAMGRSLVVVEPVAVLA